MAEYVKSIGEINRAAANHSAQLEGGSGNEEPQRASDLKNMDDLANVQIALGDGAEGQVLEDPQSEAPAGSGAGNLENSRNSIMPGFLANSAHPITCVFHLAFKIVGLTCYCLFGLFSSEKILCYIIVITMSACDFWTVKNVSGRILVGLRWWSVIKENGKEEWYYESLADRNVNSIDSRVFWISQYTWGIVWVLFGLVSLFTLSISNMTVCIVSAILSITNTLAYIKCDKSHSKKVGSFFMKKAQDNLSREQMATIGLAAMSAGGNPSGSIGPELRGTIGSLQGL